SPAWVASSNALTASSGDAKERCATTAFCSAAWSVAGKTPQAAPAIAIVKMAPKRVDGFKSFIVLTGLILCNVPPALTACLRHDLLSGRLSGLPFRDHCNHGRHHALQN